MKAGSPKIPMTVIGGFLGAGKTTFLNHLLATGEERYAVLVNDFGEINVDIELIERHDGATMALTNGCICCAAGGDFFKTLARVLDSNTPFDHIVIEASGVGDSWRVAEIALIEPSLKLNTLIAIADAARIRTQLADTRIGDTVRSQLARSDVVLLNKIDLVDEALLRAAKHSICEVRSMPVEIVETSRDSMPTLASLVSATEQSSFQSEATQSGQIDHEAEFRRWIYRRDGWFDRSKFAEAIMMLPPELLRLKGSCRFSREESLVAFQMVEKTWSVSSSLSDRGTLTHNITLVGVGTSDLPSPAILDRILDQALAS